MNRIAATPGTSRASAASACGPCSATSPRSVTGVTVTPARPRRCAMSCSAQAAFHDQQVMIAPVGEHQVVQDPARIVGEQAVTLPPGRQARDICGDQRLQRRGGGGHVAIIRGDQHLSHVADVEQPGPRAGVQMFGHHPHRVLHGMSQPAKGTMRAPCST